MNISSVSAPSSQSILSSRALESAEGAGPDNDGDADDMAVSTAATAKAPVAQGVGQLLDAVA